eukprot:NODE_1526_length_1697_cov_70.866582_g1448_i0.p1 GENE.NODE_1526_length_1697_cov_70.866582_g1448_i0~~NODE_1526_length_1697_cov_70.866582_g1448_i0.p1  ORF type:complete len:456 (+),score=95.77 NODE_1526_length_1697_cov_70.866582_g1448_i0:119-1486(+)
MAELRQVHSADPVWGRKKEEKHDEITDEELVAKVMTEIRHIYHTAVQPIELKYNFEFFRPVWFSEKLKIKTPLVLFVGPYSSGKTSFINYLLGKDYLKTGSEPTTTKFTVLMHTHEGEPDTLNEVSGRVLVTKLDQPYRGLAKFGNAFIEAFEGYELNHDLLKRVTLVDTPGVLESGVSTRAYDYIEAMQWFVDRADLIITLFDPNKLDAGPELKSLFNLFKNGNVNKVRVCLNKVDTVDPPQSLVRVHGTLLWSIANLLSQPEPPRIYLGSFWNRPPKNPMFADMYQIDFKEVMADFNAISPFSVLGERITMVNRRAKEVYVHAYVVSTVRDKLPPRFILTKATTAKTGRDMLPGLYEELAEKHQWSVIDFPKPNEWEPYFQKGDFDKYPPMEDLKPNLDRLLQFTEVLLPGLVTAISASTDPEAQRAKLIKYFKEQPVLPSNYTGSISPRPQI